MSLCLRWLHDRLKEMQQRSPTWNDNLFKKKKIKRTKY